MRDANPAFGRRPRPVAGAPCVPLADGERIAKAWLLALVADAPLRAVPAIPAADLAREAPALCAAVVRAIGSDAELGRLQPGGDLAGVAARVGALAGASTDAGTARAVETLRIAAWNELRIELQRPDTELVADLADRLAHILATVGETALSEPVSHPLDGLEDGVVELHELRGRAAGRPWTEALERRLERGGNVPLAVLAVEVDDLERIVGADGDGDVAEALEAAETAISGELRPADGLHRERPGRWWLTLPDTEAGDARGLAERVGAAVAGAATLHDAPLTVSMGVAVWPQDGADAIALVQHADTGVFAARAAGVRLA